jgi:hypothetical protein
MPESHGYDAPQFSRSIGSPDPTHSEGPSKGPALQTQKDRPYRHAHQAHEHHGGRSDQGASVLHRVLGFTKKSDFPMGEYRWITVVSEGRDDLGIGARTERQSGRQGVSGSHCSRRASRSARSRSRISARSSRA